MFVWSLKIGFDVKTLAAIAFGQQPSVRGNQNPIEVLINRFLKTGVDFSPVPQLL